MLAVALWVTACSPVTSRPTTSEAHGGGLCQVFTEGMAVAALRGAVGAPSWGESATGDYCQYTLAADADTTVEVRLEPMSPSDFAQLANAMMMDEQVEDLAEAAFKRHTGRDGLPGITVIAFGGGRCVTITITAEGDAELQFDAADVTAEAVLVSAP